MKAWRRGQVRFDKCVYLLNTYLLDGKLYFHGEKVKSVSTFGGDKVFEQSKETEHGLDYEAESFEESVEEDTSLDNKLGSIGDITKGRVKRRVKGHFP